MTSHPQIALNPNVKHSGRLKNRVGAECTIPNDLPSPSKTLCNTVKSASALSRRLSHSVHFLDVENYWLHVYLLYHSVLADGKQCHGLIHGYMLWGVQAWPHWSQPVTLRGVSFPVGPHPLATSLQRYNPCSTDILGVLLPHWLERWSESLQLKLSLEFRPVQYSSTETATRPWPSASPGCYQNVPKHSRIRW